MTNIDGLLDNERLLFRHAASLSKKRGDLVVTNLRLMFIPHETSEEKKTLTWANILNIEYSPPDDPRTAMRVRSVLNADQKLIIQLVGATNKIEFEKAKEIISQIRNPKVSPALEVVSESGKKVAIEAKTRILNADRKLANLYRELVQVGKVLTEEDFWKAHSELLQKDTTDKDFTNQKGNNNSILFDLITRDEKGEMLVTLTVEIKQLIFKRYPAARKAFETEVPLKQSEQEFWRRFFLSEVLNQTSLRDDKFFGKYVDEKTDTVHSFLAVAKNKQKFSLPMNISIDLTATVADHANRENPYQLERKDEGLSYTQNIAHRCNEDSFVILAGTDGNALSSSSSSSSSSSLLGKRKSLISDDLTLNLSELSETILPTYDILNLQDKLASTMNNNNHQASFAMKKKATIEPSSDSYDLLPAKELGLRATQYLPPSTRAEKLFKADIAKFAKLDAIANTSMIASEEHASCKGLLTERFRQEMSEQYYQLTELLRHFYALIYRIALDHSCRTKAQAIITRLVEENNVTLETKKKTIMENKADFVKNRSEQSFEATLSVINDLQLLIQRARTSWTTVQSSGI